MKVIAFTGGKGGVGKTQTSVRSAACLAEQGYRVLLIDGDYSLANANLLLGVVSTSGFADIVHRGVALGDAVTPVSKNLDLLAGLSGEQVLLNNSPQRVWALEALIDQARGYYDLVLIDTPAGVAEGHLELLQHSDEIIFMVASGTASLTDAYALMKLLLRRQCRARYHMLGSMIERKADAERLYERFDRVCQEFIQVPLYYRGFLPIDSKLLRGHRRELTSDEGAYGRAIHKLCAQIHQWPNIQATA